jgi:hypothetical protein
MPSLPNPILNAPDCFMVHWNEVIVQFWKLESTEKSSLVIGEAMRQLGRTYPDGIAVVVVMEPEGTLTTAVRAKIMQIVKDYSRVLKGVAIVLDNVGLKATASRFFINTLTLSSPVPQRAHANIHEAVRWVGDRLSRKNKIWTDALEKYILGARKRT